MQNLEQHFVSNVSESYRQDSFKSLWSSNFTTGCCLHNITRKVGEVWAHGLPRGHDSPWLLLASRLALPANTGAQTHPPQVVHTRYSQPPSFIFESTLHASPPRGVFPTLRDWFLPPMCPSVPSSCSFRAGHSGNHGMVRVVVFLI